MIAEKSEGTKPLKRIFVYLVKPSMVSHGALEYELYFLNVISIDHRIDALGKSHQVIQRLNLVADEHQEDAPSRGHGHGL